MTLFNNYTVEYFVSNTWTAIANLQELSCTIGRRQITDDWQVSQATFRFRYPTGFASPLAGLQVGTPIRFKSPNSGANAAWTGFVKDAVVDYGKPYSSGVGVADFLTITAEGAMGLWGRTAGTGFTPISNLANGQLSEVLNNYGLNWNGNLTNEPVQPVATTTTVLDWFQKFVNTTQSRPIDGAARQAVDDPYRRGTVFVANNADIQKATVSFSDTTNDATRQVYDQIEFDGIADNYFTQTVVTSPSYADQTANRGSAPYRSYTVDTYANSATQAADIAAYLLAQGQGAITPTSISCTSSAQNVSKLDAIGSNVFVFIVNNYTEIRFRGTTFTARIEGATLTATPDQTRVTYYLSSQAANPYLILDSTAFGILDTNRLALYAPNS